MCVYFRLFFVRCLTKTSCKHALKIKNCYAEDLIQNILELFAGDKFMSKIQLRLPRFMYSACPPLTKDSKRL